MLVAALIIGMAKSGFAGGIGILAVPITANVLPADVALGVLLPVLIAADIVASATHFKNVAWKQLRPMLLGSVPGIVLASVLLLWLGDIGGLARMLNLVVGSLCLVLVGLQAWRLAGRPLPRVPSNASTAGGVGGLCGLISTLTHAAGPIASIYLLELRFDKAKLVATAAWFFLLLNVAKVPTYAGLGLINPGTLKQSLWMASAVPLGAWLGIVLHKRIPEKPFQFIIYVAAAAASARMLYLGLT